MPAGYDFEGASPLLPDNGVVDGSGMLMQDPQLRDALARMLQAQQGQPPQGVPQMPGMNLDQSPGSGNRPYPDMSPASDPAMQQQVPGQRPYPDMTPDMPPQMLPQLQGVPNNPDGVPGLGPQSNSAFKLPMSTARAKGIDPEWEGLDILGGAKSAPGLRRS